jgi:hypothetical protein
MLFGFARCRVGGVVVMTLGLSGMAGPFLDAQTERLSEAQVLAAIATGESGHAGRLTTTCVAHPEIGEAMTAARAGGVQRDGNFTLTVATAAGEIAVRAAAARKLNKWLHIEEISDETRVAGISVLAQPDPPRTSNTGDIAKTSVAGIIQDVEIRLKAQPGVVVEPGQVDVEPLEWKVVGDVIPGNRAVARFSFSQLRALPVGDVDVVVITRDGERRCTVSQRERRRLLAAQ